MTATPLTAAEFPDHAAELAELLLDTVRGGNSLGFLASLDHAEAAAWWRSLAPEVDSGALTVWVTRTGGRIDGTVGLRRETKPNGRHRGEVVKLMVHSGARGRGLARALLTAAETAAAGSGLRLLVLDTETGSPAEHLYRAAGWTEAGRIPDYATDPAGRPHPTTLFYKQLPEAPPAR